ncbi:MAG: polysaccharide biosynthesis/export family protein, partial [Telluria sp.]
MPPLLVVKGNEVSKIMTNLTKLALASACALTLSGCAVWDKFRSPAQSPVSMASAVPADYLIGPGDAVNIIVWRNPEVSMSVPVRPDGKITTPLVEDLPAAGKTSTELA